MSTVAGGRVDPRAEVVQLRQVGEQHGYDSPKYEEAVAQYSDRMRRALIERRAHRMISRVTTPPQYLVEETTMKTGAVEVIAPRASTV